MLEQSQGINIKLLSNLFKKRFFALVSLLFRREYRGGTYILFFTLGTPLSLYVPTSDYSFFSPPISRQWWRRDYYFERIFERTDGKRRREKIE